jgi:hypothetical protein
MSTLLKDDLLFNDKNINHYIKSQLKLIKKNKEMINSESIFEELVRELEKKYALILSGNDSFVIDIANISITTIRDDIDEIVDKHYQPIDTSFLFKYNCYNNELLVRRKRKI